MKKIEDLDIWEKHAVWIDYMITHTFWRIQNSKPYTSLNSSKKNKSFDEFCIDLKDTRKSEYLHGWYVRFHKRIFKNNL